MLLIDLSSDRALTHQYFIGTMRAFLAALDMSSNWTAEQIPRLERIAEQTAVAAGLSPAERRNVLAGACLHDIGKIGVDKDILNKPAALTDEERTHMMQHPEIGYRALREVRFPEAVANAALCHHEKWDGSGYPHGLKGEQIPLSAQVITVVDAFDAMVSERPYKKARSYDDAVAELKRCSGSHFSPAIVTAFCSIRPESLKGYEDVSWQ